MFRIRLHGRGGQGVKTAGRVLGAALFRASFEVQDAPVYGAERRGAPMVSYVRAGREPIRERGVIARPQLVALVDETLALAAAASILQGMDERSVLLVRSPLDAQTWRRRLALAGPVVTLSPELAFPGVACAGAAARLLGAVSREHLGEALAGELQSLGEPLVARNLECALRAYDEAAPHEGIVRGAPALPASGYAPPGWIELAAEPLPGAAPDIFAAATSVGVRTGLWRTLRPVIDAARCNRCSWICSTLCPDSAIHAGEGAVPQIDYEHCKGCMVCVSVCPPHAIAAVPEREAAA